MIKLKEYLDGCEVWVGWPYKLFDMTSFHNNRSRRTFKRVSSMCYYKSRYEADLARLKCYLNLSAYSSRRY